LADSARRSVRRGLEGQRRGRVRIGIVDDHPVFRLGLARALERQSDLEITWELSSAVNLASMMQKTPVDVLLIDVYLRADEDGITATREVRARWPNVKVAAMSASLDAHVSAASKRAGANVFLAKALPVSEIVAAIRKLVDVPRQGRSDTHGSGSRVARAGLSPRQRQVLEYIRVGRTNKEIAARLGVSVATVNKHVHEVLSALGVKNRTQAAALAHEKGD
jgi:DNA-binding NarL/FixJ family response regulator